VSADGAADAGEAHFDLDHKTLSCADKRAVTVLQEYKRIETKLIECGIDRPTDRQAYEKLIEEDAASGENETRPCFGTWARILRLGRGLTGQHKHRPRKGRATPGHSVVEQSEI